MDISPLKKQTLQVWIPLFDDVEVLCKHLSQSGFDAIQQAATTISFDPRTHAKKETVDDQKFRGLLARAVVVDWRGITNDGEPWPCIPENLDYFMEECTEFRLLVQGAPLSLERMMSLDREANRKNLLTTSAPSQTTQA